MIAEIKKEFLEIGRTKKLLILAVIFLFVAISSPILAKLIPTIFKNIQAQGITIQIPEPTWRDAIDQFIKNLSQIAMIVLVFVFAGTVAEEKNKKTFELVLSKPVTRASIILAKAKAALGTTAAVYSISAIIFYTYTVSLFGSFSLARFSLVAILVLIYLAQAIAITILASVFTSNQIISAGIAFFIEIIIVTILGSIDKISRFMPGYILGQYREIMAGSQIAYWPSALVNIGIIAVSIILAVMIFQRQEIER